MPDYSSVIECIDEFCLVLEKSKYSNVPLIIFRKPIFPPEIEKLEAPNRKMTTDVIAFEYTFCTMAFVARLYVSLDDIDDRLMFEIKKFEGFTVIDPGI